MMRKVVVAMSEQTTASNQINHSVSATRNQTSQVVRALAEQSKALRDMTSAAHNISKQVSLITRDNREHSMVATAVAQALDHVGARQPNAAKAKAAGGNGGKRSPARTSRLNKRR